MQSNKASKGNLISLRQTMSSESSAFIANCDQVRNRHTKKELDVWYKEIRYNLRAMSESQRKLYRSLLKISKKKKAIKIQREFDDIEHSRDFAELRWLANSDTVSLSDTEVATLPAISTKSSSPNSTGSNTQSKRNKRKNIRNNRIPKRFSDASKELNAKSSIQAMEGKTYEVPTYRRNVDGMLCEERRTVNTTVDVSRYFNFKYHCDKRIRQRLLEASKTAEQKQNQRVSDFLSKLDQDNKRTAETDTKEQNDMIKSESSSEMKPPQYGILREDTLAPNYVRKYKRTPSRTTGKNTRDKRKSSWYVPSLHTLNFKNSTSSTRSSCHAYAARSDQAADAEQTRYSCLAHLVNVNLGKCMPVAG